MLCGTATWLSSAAPDVWKPESLLVHRDYINGTKLGLAQILGFPTSIAILDIVFRRDSPGLWSARPEVMNSNPLGDSFCIYPKRQSNIHESSQTLPSRCIRTHTSLAFLMLTVLASLSHSNNKALQQLLLGRFSNHRDGLVGDVG